MSSNNKRRKSSAPRILGVALLVVLAGGYFWQRTGVAFLRVNRGRCFLLQV